MTMVAEASDQLLPPCTTHDPGQCVRGDSPAALADIANDHINLAIWQREPALTLNQAAQALVKSRPDFRFQESGSPDNLYQSLSQQLPELPGKDHLAQDIHLLAEMMSCLFDHETLGLRLSALNKAMCPKYHVDRVHCRLITTYIGPGMQWLPDHAISRTSQNGNPLWATAQDGELPHQHIACQSVALCKGEAWPGNAGKGLIHRSPAPDPGFGRLLLTIDLV